MIARLLDFALRAIIALQLGVFAWIIAHIFTWQMSAVMGAACLTAFGLSTWLMRGEKYGS